MTDAKSPTMRDGPVSPANAVVPPEPSGATGQVVPHRRFPTLDAMRGLGAIGVMIYHGTLTLFAGGFPAVDFFFLFSGFVFGYAYAGLVGRQVTAAQFAVIRLIRLYPLYLAGIVIGVGVAGLLMWLGDAEWTRSRLVLATLANAAFLPYFSDSAYGVFPINMPAWTMFFELVVNAVFAIRRFSLRGNLAIVLVALPFLIWALSAFEGGGGSMPQDFVGGFPRAFFSFYVGIVCSQLYATGRLPVIRLPALIFPALMLAIYASPLAGSVLGATLLIAVVQPILGVTALESRTPPRVVPLFHWLGDISYAVYIIHFPIQLLVDALIKVASHQSIDTDTSPYTLLISSPIVILGAHVLTRYVDKPLRRRLTQTLLRRARPASEASAN